MDRLEQSILRKEDRQIAEEKVIKDRLNKSFDDVATSDLPSFAQSYKEETDVEKKKVVKKDKMRKNINKVNNALFENKRSAKSEWVVDIGAHIFK